LWQKGAVIGSIWAGIEIIFGSFLHNLRIPFAGTLLAVTGIFLLVGFKQLWREPGVIVRAGIICALMKSISPSAIILGPMAGIFLEAFFLEISVFFLGRNLFAYWIGGILAVSSALIQKIVNLLILYGFDLIAIAAPLYKFLAKQTHLQNVSPGELIAGVFALYAVAGIIAATGGYLAGKRYVKNPLPMVAGIMPPAGNTPLFPSGQGKSGIQTILVLLFLFSGMIFTLFLIGARFFPWGVAAAVAYFTYCLLNYKKAAGKLKKPVLWIQFLIITLISALLWEWARTGNYFSVEGLMAGIKMNLRAVIVILGFIAISVELRSPVIKALLTKNGFLPLYNALELSFSALPSVLGSLPKNKPGKSSFKLMPVLMAKAESLLAEIEKGGGSPPLLFVIAGEVNEGKTTFARKLADELAKQNVEAEGFLSEGEFKTGQKIAFYLRNLKTGERKLLCTDESQPGWAKTGRYYFDPQTLEYGNNLLKSASENSAVIIDEVGPLESKHKQGWADGILFLQTLPGCTQIWVVRKSLLPLVKDMFSVAAGNIFDIRTADAGEAAGKIIKSISRKPSKK